MTENLGAVGLVGQLMVELATELDLHYEEPDLFALTPTIEVLKRGAKFLADSGHSIPAEVEHILGRYHRASQ